MATLGVLGSAGTVGAQAFLPALSNPVGDRAEYCAQEFSAGTFGTDSIEAQTVLDPFSGNRIKQPSPLGTGGTANYFFSRHLGIGVNAYSKDTSHNFVDTTSGNLIARFPLAETGFAPYVFGGTSYRFDDTRENLVAGGAGMEFRFPHHTGALLDVSYILPDKVENYGVGRVGLRFNF